MPRIDEGRRTWPGGLYTGHILPGGLIGTTGHQASDGGTGKPGGGTGKPGRGTGKPGRGSSKPGGGSGKPGGGHGGENPQPST